MLKRLSLVCAFIVVSLGGATHGVGSIYSDWVIGRSRPVIYWDMDTNNGLYATDLAPLGAPTASTTGERTFNASYSGAGPNPATGYPYMAPSNIALTLDGTNDTIVNQGISGNTLPDAGVGTSAYSAGVWFNSSVAYNTKIHSYVLGRGETYPNAAKWDSVGVGGTAGFTGKLFYFNGNDSSPVVYSGSRTLNADTWYHALFVRDGNTVQGYLNGVLEFSGTAAWYGGSNPGNKIVFGGRGDYFSSSGNSPYLCLTGRVDEAAVWGRALTAREAALAYQSALSSYAVSILESSPAAYWRLNETAGDNLARDTSGNGKHQTLGTGVSPYVTRSGAPPDVGPQWAYAVRSGLRLGGFENTNYAPTIPIGRTGNTDNDYALVVHSGTPSVVVPDDQYTVEAWIRPSNTTNYGLVGYIFHRRDFDGTSGFGDALGMGGTYNVPPNNPPPGALFYYNGTTSTWDSTPTILVPDQWYHVAFVRNGSNISVYLDGELELAATSAVSGTFDQGTWVFGGRSDSALPPNDHLKWPGNIDEIAIFGRALSQEEIRAHFNAALVPEPAAWILLAMGVAAVAGWRWRKVILDLGFWI